MDNCEGGTSHGHEAVNRLFEMARQGDTASGEFEQLDSVIQEGLLRTYGAEDETEGNSVRSAAN
jgi:hypothetical protein